MHFKPDQLRLRSLLLLTIMAMVLSVLNGNKANAQTPPPPAPSIDASTHAAHAAAGTHPGAAAPSSDPALLQQLSQLREKLAQLESKLGKNVPTRGGTAIPGMSGGGASASPMAGMSGGNMNMMGMMEKMMGMMDKMMSMGGGGMSMGDDKMEMNMGGSMASGTPSMGMSGGGNTSMDSVEMAAMMGMGAMNSSGPGTLSQSALPGFPGASHLYHIGATGFFLDHPQHITLTVDQQAGLNKAKEQAMLAKSAADRSVQQAEQALWTLTAADQPDVNQIEAKVREIEKLRSDERLAFIRAVGEASKLLTDEQRKILTGFAAPAPTPKPSSGMKGM